MAAVTTADLYFRNGADAIAIVLLKEDAEIPSDAKLAAKQIARAVSTFGSADDACAWFGTPEDDPLLAKDQQPLNVLDGT